MSGRIWRSGVLLLICFPGWALGEQSMTVSTSLVLEVRSCECAVTKPEGSQTTVLPGFLEESTLLQTDVPEAGSGRLSSDDLSLDFEVSDVQDSPGTYRFRYSGKYTSGTGDNASHADLVLAEGQWFPLFQLEQYSGREKDSFGVAVRLVNASGS